MILHAEDADLFYELRGQGPDVVLLHPYPCDHRFWLPMAQHLESRFRLVLPDLRGLGRSGVGQGATTTMPMTVQTTKPTTMATLAADLLRLCDELKIGRAVFLGCSVGGYALFEFWRRSRERIQALVLMDTKASLDSETVRRGRLLNAEELLDKGPRWAVDQLLPRLLSPVTMASRLDVVERARETMLDARAAGMAALQRGMAERTDSIPTLAEIDVPTLVVGGEDDVPSPVSELERMARGIRGSDGKGAELKIVAKAGHLAAFEQPEEVGRIVREFLERNGR